MATVLTVLGLQHGRADSSKQQKQQQKSAAGHRKRQRRLQAAVIHCYLKANGKVLFALIYCALPYATVLLVEARNFLDCSIHKLKYLVANV
jgi:hypothetical protein